MTNAHAYNQCTQKQFICETVKRARVIDLSLVEQIGQNTAVSARCYAQSSAGVRSHTHHHSAWKALSDDIRVISNSANFAKLKIFAFNVCQQLTVVLFLLTYRMHLRSYFSRCTINEKHYVPEEYQIFFYT